MLYQDHQRPALSFSLLAFPHTFKAWANLPPRFRHKIALDALGKQKDVNDRDLVAVSGCYGGFMGNQQIWGYDGNYVLMYFCAKLGGSMWACTFSGSLTQSAFHGIRAALVRLGGTMLSS
jgi:hypothetical protein